MRKAFLLVPLTLALLLAGLALKKLLTKPPDLIGEDVALYEIVKGEEPVGTSYFLIPYKTDSKDYEWINIRADLNQNGRFEDNEWLIKNSWATSKTELPDAFYFDSSFEKKDRPRNFKTQIKLSKDKLDSFGPVGLLSRLRKNEVLVERAVPEISKFDYSEYQDHEEHPDFIEDHEGSHLLSTTAAFAQETGRDKGVFRDDVPDLTQPKTSGSCAIYSTANSFLWLAKKHGYKGDVFKEDVFGKYSDLLARLISCLEWDPRGGVKRSKVIKGKECFIERFKLPLEAHEITWEKQGKVGENILDALFSELEKGQDVELGLSLFKGDKKTGGHMVTLVGVKGGKIKVQDPANGKQTDEYEVDDEGTLTGYRVFKDSDKAVIVAAFAESPKVVKEEPKTIKEEEKPTTTPAPTPTPEEEQPKEEYSPEFYR